MTKPILLALILALSGSALANITCRACGHQYDPRVTVYKGKALDQILVIAAQKEGYPLSPTERRAAISIVQKESEFRTTARNPRSTSKGLFGLLNGTRRDVGIAHNLCPVCQARSGMRYVRSRRDYGRNFRGALRSHASRGSY